MNGTEDSRCLLHAQQRFLDHWQPVMQATRGQPEHKGLIRWLVDVDPLAI